MSVSSLAASIASEISGAKGSGFLVQDAGTTQSPDQIMFAANKKANGEALTRAGMGPDMSRFAAENIERSSFTGKQQTSPGMSLC